MQFYFCPLICPCVNSFFSLLPFWFCSPSCWRREWGSSFEGLDCMPRLTQNRTPTEKGKREVPEWLVNTIRWQGNGNKNLNLQTEDWGYLDYAKTDRQTSPKCIQSRDLPEGQFTWVFPNRFELYIVSCTNLSRK